MDPFDHCLVECRSSAAAALPSRLLAAACHILCPLQFRKLSNRRRKFHTHQDSHLGQLSGIIIARRAKSRQGPHVARFREASRVPDHPAVIPQHHVSHIKVHLQALGSPLQPSNPMLKHDGALLQPLGNRPKRAASGAGPWQDGGTAPLRSSLLVLFPGLSLSSFLWSSLSSSLSSDMIFSLNC